MSEQDENATQDGIGRSVKFRLTSGFVIQIVAILVAGSVVSLVIVYAACTAARQPVRWVGPIEEWVNVGFERRRLEDLDSMNVFSREDYDAELQLIQEKEAVIIGVYPYNFSEFQAESRADEAAAAGSRRLTLMIALSIWILTSVSAILGLIFAWRHDRRIASQLEDELNRLKRKQQK